MSKHQNDPAPFLDPRRLGHLLAVMEAGGFGRAARMCGLTQQALSKSILRLEDALQCRLLERTPTGVMPTLFAERLAVRARLIIAESHIAAAEIEALRGYRSGLLRLGAGLSLCSRIVPRAIADLRRRLPDVGVKIVSGNTQHLAPLLLAGELDLVISAPSASVATDPELQVEVLGSERDQVVARAGHPLHAVNSPGLADFLNYPWIGETNIFGVLGRVSDASIQHGLEPPTDVIGTDSMAAVRGILLETDALCLLPSSLYLVEAATGMIAPLSCSVLETTREIRLHRRRRGHLSPAARLTMELLRKRVEESQVDVVTHPSRDLPPPNVDGGSTPIHLNEKAGRRQRGDGRSSP